MAGLWKSVSRAVAMIRPTGASGFKSSARKLQEQITAQSLGEMHKPTAFQKKTLVWARMYKSIDEVPDRVSTLKLKKAQDICRIYGNFSLIVIGIFVAAGVIGYSRHLRNTGQDSATIRYHLQMAKLKQDAENAAVAAAAKK